MKLFVLLVVTSAFGLQASRVNHDTIEGTHTAAARTIRRIGAAEKAVMKELRGHPQLQQKERHYLEEAADLVLRASQIQQHKHHPAHATALIHEGSHAADKRTMAKTESSLEAESHTMMHRYGREMFHFAKQNLHLAKEIAQAKLAVAKELKRAGANSDEVAMIEEELGKARKLEQRIVHSETKEAKEILHKEKSYQKYGLAQTETGHHATEKATSVTALKAHNRLALRKYGLHMSQLARSNRHLAMEISHAKAAVLKALKRDGAPMNVMDEVSKGLNEAKKMQRKVTVMEEHEAKSALKKSKKAGLVQESSGASVTTGFEAHRQMVAQKYAAHMSHLARKNRRIGNEIARANRAIAQALKRDGASSEMQHEIAAELSKAKSVVQKLAHREAHDAKTAFRKPKITSLTQSESKATMKSMAALKVEAEMEQQQYRQGMSHLAKEEQGTVHEMSEARDKVAEALDKAGATAAMENKVDALLGQAELEGRRLMNDHKQEAKKRVTSFTQSESQAMTKSMAAARQQYRRGMSHLAKEEQGTVHEMSQARDKVAQALDKVGATPEFEDKLDALLGKAELEGRKLMNEHKHEAKV